MSPTQLLSFYKQVEKLKLTMRHSWLSDGKRQESVAEHSWMMSLLAMVLAPQIGTKIDLQKVLLMIVIHDLAEAVTSDLPVWEGTKDKQAKFENEKKAMETLLRDLDDETRSNLMSVWQEYEQRESAESVFVKAIDTLDVITQHNCAPLTSWDDNDYLWQLSPLQNAFFDFDPYLRQVKDAIDQWSIAKVKEAGNLSKLDQTELKKRTSL